MAKVVYMEPIADLTGKISKSSDLVFKHTSFHEKIVHRLGKRNYGLNPLSPSEEQHRKNFSTIAKNVTARMKPSSATYEQDIVNFLAQRDLPGGYKRFRPFLWHDEMSKLG